MLGTINPFTAKRTLQLLRSSYFLEKSLVVRHLILAKHNNVDSERRGMSLVQYVHVISIHYFCGNHFVQTICAR